MEGAALTSKERAVKPIFPSQHTITPCLDLTMSTSSRPLRNEGVPGHHGQFFCCPASSSRPHLSFDQGPDLPSLSFCQSSFLLTSPPSVPSSRPRTTKSAESRTSGPSDLSQSATSSSKTASGRAPCACTAPKTEG